MASAIELIILMRFTFIAPPFWRPKALQQTSHFCNS
jgi:hypothetical protein